MRERMRRECPQGKIPSGAMVRINFTAPPPHTQDVRVCVRVTSAERVGVTGGRVAPSALSLKLIYAADAFCSVR